MEERNTTKWKRLTEDDRARIAALYQRAIDFLK